MAKIKLNDLAYAELKELSICLYNNHYDIARNNVTGEIEEERTSTSKMNKFAVVLNYASSTIYNISSSGSISSKYFNTFCSKFDKLRVLSKHSASDNDILNKYIELKRKIESDNGLVEKSVSRNVADQFKNTKWYIFERFFDHIGRKILAFGDIQDNKIEVTVNTAEPGRFPWNGKAYVDSSGNFLIIQTTTNSQEDNALPTNYMIRIDKSAFHIELCIGHVSFISEKNNVVTKTIVLKKTERGEILEVGRLPLDEESTKSIVGTAVFKFLKNRLLNRLSSPHSTIISMDSLKGWQEKNRLEKRKTVNHNVFGQYIVYYRGELKNRDLTEDYLCITQDENDDVTAVYIHQLDAENQHKWVGKLTYSPNTKSLFASLEGPYTGQSELYTSSIFLILNLPSGDRNFSSLIGIVSGLNDDYDLAVGLLIVAHKFLSAAEYPSPMEYEDFLNKKTMDPVGRKKLEDFFEAFAHRAIITPPRTPIAKMDDLSKAIKEIE